MRGDLGHEASVTLLLVEAAVDRESASLLHDDDRRVGHFDDYRAGVRTAGIGDAPDAHCGADTRHLRLQ